MSVLIKAVADRRGQMKERMSKVEDHCSRRCQGAVSDGKEGRQGLRGTMNMWRLSASGHEWSSRWRTKICHTEAVNLLVRLLEETLGWRKSKHIDCGRRHRI